jgi:hypothetical protein
MPGLDGWPGPEQDLSGLTDGIARILQLQPQGHAGPPAAGLKVYVSRAQQPQKAAPEIENKNAWALQPCFKE